MYTGQLLDGERTIATYLPKDIWDKINGGLGYDPDFCLKIIHIFNDEGNMSDFCLSIGASRQRVTKWQMEHPEFSEAVELAKDIAMVKWIRDGQDNLDNKDFNVRLWEALGKRQFGNSDKIAIRMTKDKSPIQHYHEIMHQASLGSFTSSELKQIMECINIGLRAEEICTMQEEIDGLKEGLAKMEERELEHQIADSEAPKEDKASVGSEDGEAKDS